MTPGRSLLLFAMFIVGFATASLSSRDEKKRQDEPIDVAAPVRIIRCTNPGLQSHEYTPYRVVVDGEARRVADAPEGRAEVWRVELANGRAVLFAVEKPAE